MSFSLPRTTTRADTLLRGSSAAWSAVLTTVPNGHVAILLVRHLCCRARYLPLPLYPLCSVLRLPLPFVIRTVVTITVTFPLVPFMFRSLCRRFKILDLRFR